MRARPWSQRDNLVALLLAVTFGALFVLMMQSRLYGDGAILVRVLPGDEKAGRFHVGYHLGREFLHWAWAGADWTYQARLFSALCGGLGCGFTFLFARGLGLSRPTAVSAAVLAASTPALIFFATTVEIHTLQFCLVALGACIALTAPWRMPLLAIPVSAFGLFLAVSGHETSILLGPGWVLLCAWHAEKQGARFSRARGLLVVGPSILALVLLALFGLHSFIGGTGDAVASGWGLMNAWVGAFDIASFLGQGVLFPLLFVAPLFGIGIGSQRFGPRLRWAMGISVLVPLVFVLWFRVPERGGYMLGLLPFLAPVAAVGLQSIAAARRAAALGLILTLQVAGGLWAKHDYDSMLDPARRMELVRKVTGGSGTFLTANAYLPPLRLDDPKDEQYSLGPMVSESIRGAVTPQEFATNGLALVEFLVAQDPSVLKRGLYFESVQAGPGDTKQGLLFQPYFQGLEAALGTKFDFEWHQLDEWRIAKLTGK